MFILRIDDQSQYFVDAYAPELSVKPPSSSAASPWRLTSAALQGRAFHGVVKEVNEEAPRIEEGWKNQRARSNIWFAFS